MSIQSFEINLVDLYVNNPSPDRDYAPVIDPQPVLTNLPCTVQPANFGMTEFWGTQQRMTGGYAIYFNYDLVWTAVVDGVTVYNHITVQEGVPMQSYTFRWYNDLWTSPDVVVPPATPKYINLRLRGWGEDTKGLMNLWRADCEQVA